MILCSKNSATHASLCIHCLKSLLLLKGVFEFIFNMYNLYNTLQARRSNSASREWQQIRLIVNAFSSCSGKVCQSVLLIKIFFNALIAFICILVKYKYCLVAPAENSISFSLTVWYQRSGTPYIMLDSSLYVSTLIKYKSKNFSCYREKFRNYHVLTSQIVPDHWWMIYLILCTIAFESCTCEAWFFIA